MTPIPDIRTPTSEEPENFRIMYHLGWANYPAASYCWRQPPQAPRCFAMDFGEDLNAMHLAEGTLTVQQRRTFAHTLALVCLFHDLDVNRPIKFDEEWHDLDEDFFAAHATASQRRQALLLTIDRKETK